MMQRMSKPWSQIDEMMYKSCDLHTQRNTNSPKQHEVNKGKDFEVLVGLVEKEAK